MTYLLAILVCVVGPWVIGWLQGRHLPDPNTREGRLYYSNRKDM